MTHILHRSANAVYPIAVSGSGLEIVDAQGRRYLDASGGAAVSCLGHELCANLGDVVNQAADISWFATSIPSRNFTPRTTLGN
jgi:acetylornithine/succinyldiaminopimelate/putrescine aminotransferase